MIGGFDPNEESIQALMETRARGQGIALRSRKAGVVEGRDVIRSVEVLRSRQRYDDDAAPDPSRITVALDFCGLYGPEVDEACGAQEPDVDQWETGELVPTRDQVDKLAALTGFQPWWFYGDPLQPLDHFFICEVAS